MTDRANIFSLQSLSHSVYDAQWLRKWESQGAVLASVSLYQMMQRSGTAVFQRILWLYPGAHRGWCLRVTVITAGTVTCAAAGKQVTVLACGGSSPLPAEAEQTKAAWLAVDGKIHASEEPWPQGVEVIIDALLGTSLKVAMRDPYCSLIAAANQHPEPVIALDIPSGLLAESRATPGEVMSAVHTGRSSPLKRDC